MRKVQPQDVRTDFDGFVVEQLAHFERVEAALAGTSNEKRDLSILSETTLHSIYVSFECFINDLMLAYINRNSSQYQKNLKDKIDSSVTSKFGSWAFKRISFNPLKHITLQELESILDPDDYNLTFKNVAKLKQRFHDWVNSPYKNNVVNLNEADTNLIDCTHAIRDFIAHRSKGAKARMNDSLSSVSTGQNCPNAELSRGVNEIHDAGSYLKTLAGGTRRVKRYAERLRSIATGL